MSAMTHMWKSQDNYMEPSLIFYIDLNLKDFMASKHFANSLALSSF